MCLRFLNFRKNFKIISSSFGYLLQKCNFLKKLTISYQKNNASFAFLLTQCFVSKLLKISPKNHNVQYTPRSKQNATPLTFLANKAKVQVWFTQARNLPPTNRPLLPSIKTVKSLSTVGWFSSSGAMSLVGFVLLWGAIQIHYEPVRHSICSRTDNVHEGQTSRILVAFCRSPTETLDTCFWPAGYLSTVIHSFLPGRSAPPFMALLPDFAQPEKETRNNQSNLHLSVPVSLNYLWAICSLRFGALKHALVRLRAMPSKQCWLDKSLVWGVKFGLLDCFGV